MRYLDGIDALRALAVSSVVLFHADEAWLPGGFLGVDIFFVISGFLITRHILEEREAGAFSLVQFYQRRIARILPALSATLLSVLLMGAVLLTPADLLLLAQEVLAADLFGSNLYFWRNVNYFAAAAGDRLTLHTWSLGIEEQFYLFWPVLLMFLPIQRRYVGIAVLVCFLASLGLAESLIGRMPAASFYLLPTRAWELLAGAWIATRAVPSRLPLRARQNLEIGCVLGLLFVLALYSTELPHPSMYTVMPVVLSACLLYLLSAGGEVPVLARLGLITLIGRASFSIYLVHQPILVFQGYFGVAPVQERLAAIALCVVVGVCSYRYVEIPFRMWLRATSERTAFTFAGATILALALVSVSMIRSNGFVGSWNSQNPEAQRLALALNKPPQPCTQDFLETDLIGCELGDKDSLVHIVLVGDSHAGQWTSVFDSLGQQEGWRITLFAKSSCSLFDVTYEQRLLEREYTECWGWRNLLEERLRRLEADLVIAVQSSSGYFRLTGASMGLWQSVTQDYAILTESFASPVLYLLDNPVGPGFDPPRCVIYNEKFSTNRTCSASRAQLGRDVVEVEKEILERHGINVVDLWDIFCPGDVCSMRTSWGGLLSDSNHLSQSAVDVARERVRSEIRARLSGEDIEQRYR